MATEIERLVTVLEANISDFKKNMKSAARSSSSATDKIKKEFASVRGSVNNVGNAVFSLKGAFAALGLGAVVKSFVDAASTSEQFQVRLQTLLGSAREGNQLFKDMATFAGQVPFEYEEIMGAATKLSTVLKGGRKEIGEFMPMAADIAAAFGLTMEEASDQMARALSAGAGAADLFRDRGVNAMLGFTAGATVSAEEFRKTLLDKYSDVNSKFRGASEALSNTWSGTMSMLSDKWFQFRTTLLDAGVFDFLKGIAQVLNDDMGAAIDGSKGDIAGWANAIISAIEGVIKGVGFLKTAWQGITIIWDTLKVSFVGLKLLILEGISVLSSALDSMTEGFREKLQLLDKLPAPGPIKAIISGLTSIDNSLDTGAIETWASDTRTELDSVKEALSDSLSVDTTGLEQAEVFIERVRVKAAEIAKSRTDLLGQGTEDKPEAQAPDLLSKEELSLQDAMSKRFEQLDMGLMSEQERLALALEEKEFLVEEAFQEGLINEQKRKETLEALQAEHDAKMLKIHSKGAVQMKKFDQKNFSDRARATSQFMSNTLSMVAGQSRAAFNLHKVAAISEGLLDLKSAISGAYKVGARIGGPPLGAAFAAVSGAAQVANLAAIKSSSFGGGGGGTAGGGGGAVPAAPTTPEQLGVPEPNFNQEVENTGQNITINLGDDDALVSKRSIRGIIEGLQEEFEDGFNIKQIQFT